MKSKSVILMLSLVALASCQTKTPTSLPSSPSGTTPESSSSSTDATYDKSGFQEAYQKLQVKDIQFKGQTSQILYKSQDGDESTLVPDGEPVTGEMTATFNENAFSYSSTGFDDDSFQVYKNASGNPVSKYVDRNNAVKESTANVSADWSFYANPFLSVDVSLFTYEEDYEGYEVYAFEDTRTDFETASALTDPITQISFTSFKAIYFLYDAEAKAIQSYVINTDAVYMNNAFRQFNYVLTPDVSTAHTVPEITAYPEVAYKDVLLNAFNKLEDKTPYIITETAKQGEKTSTRSAGISDDYLLTASSLSTGAYPDKSSIQGWVEKPDATSGEVYVHKIIKNSDGEYGYRDTPYTDPDKGVLTNVRLFAPYRNVAVEAFRQGEDDLTFILSGKEASSFAQYFNAFADEDLFFSATDVKVVLNSDKSAVSSITYTLPDRTITDTYDYTSTAKTFFGIDVDALKPMADMAIFAGTYEGEHSVTNADGTTTATKYTVVFTGEKLAINGEDYSPLTFEEAYGETRVKWVSSNYQEGYTFILNQDKSVQLAYFSVDSTKNFNIKLTRVK